MYAWSLAHCLATAQCVPCPCPIDPSSHRQFTGVHIEDVATNSTRGLSEPLSRPYNQPATLRVVDRDVDDHLLYSGRTRHASPTPTPAELEECRELLLKVFRECSKSDFSRLSCAISCIRAAKRPLHVAELMDALVLYSFYSQHRSYHLSTTTTTLQAFKKWLSSFGGLFKINDLGYVTFENSTTQFFIQRFRINGIDPSHRTLAMLTLKRRELDTLSSKGGGSKPLSVHRSAFSGYAEEHWRYHHSIACKTSLCLRFEDPGHESGSEAGLSGDEDWIVLSKEFDRSEIEDGGEWAVIDKT